MKSSNIATQMRWIVSMHSSNWCSQWQCVDKFVIRMKVFVVIELSGSRVSAGRFSKCKANSFTQTHKIVDLLCNNRLVSSSHSSLNHKTDPWWIRHFMEIFTLVELTILETSKLGFTQSEKNVRRLDSTVLSMFFCLTTPKFNSFRNR